MKSTLTLLTILLHAPLAPHAKSRSTPIRSRACTFDLTPWSQDLSGKSPIDKHVREHQPESFCAWMAGGGVKPGLIHGDTDDMGYRVIHGKIHIHDLHATMLHLLGIDHLKLTAPHLGLDYRPTDVYGEVVKEILT